MYLLITAVALVQNNVEGFSVHKHGKCISFSDFLVLQWLGMDPFLIALSQLHDLIFSTEY